MYKLTYTPYTKPLLEIRNKLAEIEETLVEIDKRTQDDMFTFRFISSLASGMNERNWQHWAEEIQKCVAKRLP